MCINPAIFGVAQLVMPFTASTTSGTQFKVIFAADGKMTRQPRGKSGRKAPALGNGTPRQPLPRTDLCLRPSYGRAAILSHAQTAKPSTKSSKASANWKPLTATSHVDLADHPFPVEMEISFLEYFMSRCGNGHRVKLLDGWDLDHSVPIEPNGVHPRTSLWSSRFLFPGKSDFGGQRQNGNNVRGGTVRESRDQVDRAGRRQSVGIWRRPRKSLRCGD
jgi:hypothetical protein